MSEAAIGDKRPAESQQGETWKVVHLPGTCRCWTMDYAHRFGAICGRGTKIPARKVEQGSLKKDDRADVDASGREQCAWLVRRR